jgi:methionyl-tRNA synthetase
MKNYITTPIYYVNDKPHLGSAYTTIVCDTWARFQRLMEVETFFLTGTDEHGQKIQRAAEKSGEDTQAFVDRVSVSFKDLVNHLHITNDDFIRTSEKRHIIAAQAFWNVLKQKGYIYSGKYEGWYSIRDEAFYQEDELINGKAPTGAEVEWTVEESYFFKLSAFEAPLLKYIDEHPDFIMPHSRKNEVVSFIKSGLNDLSISRTSFNWGIPVPENDKHIMYVWIDALVNYLTAIGYPDNFQANLFKEAIHIVGKDILRFHAIYWPAFLMAADLPIPKQIFAHGWWTVEGEKMSKSLGNTIDPIALSNEFGVDAVRNFVLREMPFGQDGNFSKKSFINRTNADLANAYGNLVQRILSFLQKNTNRRIPIPHDFSAEDQQLMNAVDDFYPALQKSMDAFQFNKYCDIIWKVIFDCNAYVDTQKPWELNKTDQNRMNTVLYTLCETIRKIALMTLSILPEGSSKILDYLAIDSDNRTFKALNNPLIPGVELPMPAAIYPRFLV